MLVSDIMSMNIYIFFVNCIFFKFYTAEGYTTLKNFGPNRISLKYQDRILIYLQKRSPSRLKSDTDSHVSGVHFGHVRVLRERRTSIISCGRVVNIDFNEIIQVPVWFLYGNIELIESVQTSLNHVGEPV